jgi:hypothetical protein
MPDEILSHLRRQRRAKEYGEGLVKELARQSQAIMLTPAQATDALVALERASRFQEATGARFLFSPPSPSIAIQPQSSGRTPLLRPPPAFSAPPPR